MTPSLEATAYVAVLFGGLAIIIGALLGIHDGIEWLINRRRA